MTVPGRERPLALICTPGRIQVEADLWSDLHAPRPGCLCSRSSPGVGPDLGVRSQ